MTNLMLQLGHATHDLGERGEEVMVTLPTPTKLSAATRTAALSCSLSTIPHKYTSRLTTITLTDCIEASVSSLYQLENFHTNVIIFDRGAYLSTTKRCKAAQ